MMAKKLIQLCVGCWSRGKHESFTPDHAKHYFCNNICFVSFLDETGLQMEWHSIRPDKKAIGDAIGKARQRMAKALAAERHKRREAVA
jgi:hypothetical protein